MEKPNNLTMIRLIFNANVMIIKMFSDDYSYCFLRRVDV